MLDGLSDDLILGGAGDDVMGDDNYHATSTNWRATRIGNTLDVNYSPIAIADEGLSGGADVMYSGAGSDLIAGLDGNDIIHGEDGDDVMASNDHDDTFFWGAGNDPITGDHGANLGRERSLFSINQPHSGSLSCTFIEGHGIFATRFVRGSLY